MTVRCPFFWLLFILAQKKSDLPRRAKKEAARQYGKKIIPKTHQMDSGIRPLWSRINFIDRNPGLKPVDW